VDMHFVCHFGRGCDPEQADDRSESITSERLDQLLQTRASLAAFLTRIAASVQSFYRR
jgi:hypothetical protein